MSIKKVLIGVLLLGMVGSFAFAQYDIEILQGYQFNFFPPGARALAMGGAFIGLADDATAAFSNPAGMVILTKPEISGELKFSSYSTLRASLANAFATGDLSEYGESVTSPSFASIVIPMDNISIGLSMSNFINYYEKPSWDYRPVPGTTWAFYGGEGELEINGYNFSLSAAARLSDQFSIGVTASYVMFDMFAETQLTGEFGNPINYTKIDDSDGGIGITAGAMFSPSDKFSVGVVYSYYPTVTIANNFWYGGEGESGIPTSEISVDMNLPDRFGAGLAFRPMDELVVVFDVISVMYSQITENVVTNYGLTTRGDEVTTLATDDVMEIHFGVEYAILGKTPLFLRAGFFTNPNHRPYYTGNDVLEQFYWNLLDYSTEINETELGFTFGLGAVLGKNIQIDAAYLMSDSLNQGTLSVVIHL